MIRFLLMAFQSGGYTVGMLSLGLIGCCDAPRTNLFDPALTPAVGLLSVTVDNAR